MRNRSGLSLLHLLGANVLAGLQADIPLMALNAGPEPASVPLMISKRGSSTTGPKRSKPGKYIPAGFFRNCGDRGISPKSFHRANAQPA